MNAVEADEKPGTSPQSDIRGLYCVPEAKLSHTIITLLLRMQADNRFHGHIEKETTTSGHHIVVPSELLFRISPSELLQQQSKSYQETRRKRSHTTAVANAKTHALACCCC
jgi:hypothetical protein